MALRSEEQTKEQWLRAVRNASSMRITRLIRSQVWADHFATGHTGVSLEVVLEEGAKLERGDTDGLATILKLDEEEEPDASEPSIVRLPVENLNGKADRTKIAELLTKHENLLRNDLTKADLELLKKMRSLIPKDEQTPRRLQPMTEVTMHQTKLLVLKEQEKLEALESSMKAMELQMNETKERLSEFKACYDSLKGIFNLMLQHER